MKKIYGLGLSLFLLNPAYAQVGMGDTLGITTISSTQTIGITGATGQSSLPACNPSAPCQTPLPLNLLEFSGNRIDANYVNLKWTTSNEVSNSGFWVERSFGNADHLYQVFFVPAISNDELLKKYQVPDTNAYQGKTYYRLRQIDVDGHAAYSKIIVVNGYGSIGDLKVYPSPGTGIFFVQPQVSAGGNPGTGGSNSNEYTVRVYNSLGHLVYQGQTSARIYTLDLSNQANGPYIIESIRANESPKFGKIILVK